MRKFILVLVLNLCVAASFGDLQKFVNEQYDLVKISDGVYSFIAPPSNSGVVQANCTVIIGEESVLVVDSGQFPSLAERMIADIRKLTPKAVRYLVNTHWHGDHHWGNANFRDAFPALTIIGTNYTRQMIATEGPKMLANTPRQNAETAARIRKRLAEGKFSDGRPIPPDDRERFEFSAATLEHINLEIPHTRNLPPNLGFEKELTVDLGKREVRIMFLGRANTGGDAVVWIPEAKILATGDTVVWPAPFAYGSYMSEWISVVQQMIDLKPGTIIPGHGPVMHDVSYLESMREVFRALTTQVKQAVADGLSLEDTMKRVTLDDLRQKMPGDPQLRDRFWNGAFIQPAVDRAYQEATGKWKPEAED